MIIDSENGEGGDAVKSGIRGCFGYNPSSLRIMLLTDGPRFDIEAGHAAASGAEVTSAQDAESRDSMTEAIGNELDIRMHDDAVHDPMVVVMTAPCEMSDRSDCNTWETLRRIAHYGPQYGISLLCLADGNDAETVRSLVTVPLGRGICVVHGVHADNARRVPL